MKNVRVVIDRLVLTDLDLAPHEAKRLGGIIEEELKSLIQREGLPAARKTAPQQSILLDAPHGFDEQQLARSVAARLLESLYGPY